MRKHRRKHLRADEFMKFDGKKGYIIKRLHRQTGTTHKIPDKKLHALPPGERESSDGGIYWETRRNRSDLAPSKGL